jgi:hypothetical protein
MPELPLGDVGSFAQQRHYVVGFDRKLFDVRYHSSEGMIVNH